MTAPDEHHQAELTRRVKLTDDAENHTKLQDMVADVPVLKRQPPYIFEPQHPEEMPKMFEAFKMLNLTATPEDIPDFVVLPGEVVRQLYATLSALQMVTADKDVEAPEKVLVKRAVKLLGSSEPNCVVTPFENPAPGFAVFTGRGGTDKDLQKAMQHLQIGKAYRVTGGRISSFYTGYDIENVGPNFNSVMFIADQSTLPLATSYKGIKP